MCGHCGSLRDAARGRLGRGRIRVLRLLKRRSCPRRSTCRTGRRDRRLDSWKEIAADLKRDVSTVQRWERKEDRRSIGIATTNSDRSTPSRLSWTPGGIRAVNGSSAESTVANQAAHAPTTRRAARSTSVAPDPRRSRMGTVRTRRHSGARPRLCRWRRYRSSSAPSTSADRNVTTRWSQSSRRITSARSLRTASCKTKAESTGDRVVSRRTSACVSAAGGGTQQLYRRALDAEEATTIAGTEGAGVLFFARWAMDRLLGGREVEKGPDGMLRVRPHRRQLRGPPARDGADQHCPQICP